MNVDTTGNRYTVWFRKGRTFTGPLYEFGEYLTWDESARSGNQKP